MIGRAGLGIADYMGTAEIDLGYLIAETCRRQGYAKEACEAVLAYARERLDMETVSAYIDKENLPSIGLIEKLGFVQERELDYQGKTFIRYLHQEI